MVPGDPAGSLTPIPELRLANGCMRALFVSVRIDEGLSSRRDPNLSVGDQDGFDELEGSRVTTPALLLWLEFRENRPHFLMVPHRTLTSVCPAC
jgi:hypothetical protein